MSGYTAVRSGKLNLKRPASAASHDQHQPFAKVARSDQPKKAKTKSTAAAEPVGSTVWVSVESTADLLGPLFFLLESDGSRCLSVGPDGSLRPAKVAPSPEMPSSSSSSTSESPSEAALQFLYAEPVSVDQVLVGVPVVGSPGQFAFKSAEGKYLSCDKHGGLSCSREAIGVGETWTALLKPDGIAFQSGYTGKFLKVEPSTYSLRADSDECGFCETIRVKCQAARRASKKTDEDELDTRDAAELELDELKKNQSWGLGRLKRRPDQEVGSLRKAKDEGKFREALLDRREKVKSDKFCK